MKAIERWSSALAGERTSVRHRVFVVTLLALVVGSFSFAASGMVNAPAAIGASSVSSSVTPVASASAAPSPSTTPAAIPAPTGAKTPQAIGPATITQSPSSHFKAVQLPSLPASASSSAASTIHLPVANIQNHPQSWGKSTVPPGWEAILPAASSASSSRTVANALSGAALNAPSSNTNTSSFNKWCDGVWPSTGGQSTYAGNCYGHDEPNINFYSTAPGSGGNVTWTVKLPTDRSLGQNQSNLYAAIWFGLPLTVPNNAWMNMCFLELQFYPDSSFYNPSPNPLNLNYSAAGVWVGAAVAWQIQQSSGFENPCYYQPLFANGATHGATYFNMTQGDQVVVKMTGWVGSTTGENVSITDTTLGISTYVVLANRTCVGYHNYGFGACGGNYPLDPSYQTSNYENSFEWTPGGEYPAVFAFETGHAANPDWPSNSGFGGCSPGTPGNPSTPCPSYDPGSWINDTLQPWEISTPTFFNGAGTTTPGQVAFGQDLGGIAYTAGNSLFGSFNFGCQNSLGSEYCSYPWYSYSCTTHSFNFGATNWPDTSVDFGQYNQFATQYRSNGLGFAYYAPTNDTIPTCGGGSAVTVATAGTAGSVEFLSTWYSSHVGTAVPGLSSGQYSVFAQPGTGQHFSTWTVSGGITLNSAATDPVATVAVTGAGTITGTFAASAPPPVTVTFGDNLAPKFTSLAGSQIVVNAGTAVNPGTPLGVLGPGGSLALSPGIYGIQALPPSAPPVGHVFTNWTLPTGAYVASTGYPYTWLDISGAKTHVWVNATYANSSLSSDVLIQIIGNGTVNFDGVTIKTATGAYDTVVHLYGIGGTVGSWPLSAVPGSSSTGFGYWSYSDNNVMTDFASSTYIATEAGYIYQGLAASYIEAVFYAALTILPVKISPGPVLVEGGTVQVGPFGPVSTTTTFNATPGVYYPVYGSPASGYQFYSWAIGGVGYTGYNVPIGFYAYTTGPAVIEMWVDAKAAAVSVAFYQSPTAGGTTYFNGVAQPGGSVNNSVSGGWYILDAVANPGYVFTSFTTFGSAGIFAPPGLPAGLVDVYVSGNNSPTIWSFYAGTSVSFVTNIPSGSATVGSVTLGTGTSTTLLPGSYSVALAYAGAAVVHWATTSSLSVPAGTASTTTLTVTGPGTIYALVEVAATTPTATPGTLGVGGTTTFATVASGVGPYTYAWTGLPTGCASANAATVTCTPTAAGAFTVAVMVTSTALGMSVTTPSVSVTIVANPTATLKATLDPVDVGITTWINATVAGGQAPLSYAYAGMPPGCTAGSGASTLCTPTLAGAYNVTVAVTDAFGFVSNSYVVVTVHARPSITAVSVTPTQPTTGSTLTLSITATGGTGTLSYGYSGLPTGCVPTVVNTVTCTPTAAGAYVVVVTVTDAQGVSATSSASVTVLAPSSVVTTGDVNVASMWGYIGIGLGAAALAAALAAILLSRRKAQPGPLRPAETAPPQGAQGPNWSESGASETPPPPMK